MIQLIINSLKFNPDIRIAVFSTEMATEQIALRLLANISGARLHGTIPPDDRLAAKQSRKTKPL